MRTQVHGELGINRLKEQVWPELDNDVVKQKVHSVKPLPKNRFFFQSCSGFCIQWKSEAICGGCGGPQKL